MPRAITSSAGSPLPSTHQEAAEVGARHYFTGIACKHGHIANRLTSTRACMGCGPMHRLASLARDPEKKRSQRRESAARHREKNRARCAAWYAANRDAVSVAARAAYRSNPETKKAQSRRYAQSNPQKFAEFRARRRALLAGQTENFTAAQIKGLRQRSGKRCAYCQARPAKGSRLTLDHIVALANGGTNSIRNVQFLCHSCNCSKGARDAEEFARSRGLLI